MASNREERFLQRQRGAGIHKIQDIDFGLAFPGGNNVPLRPQRSSRRRTPQPDQTPLIPQRSSRRTPSSNRPLVPQSSTRRTLTTARNHLPERPSPYDLPRAQDEERRSSSQATRSDSQGSVSKKRKITAPASARRLSTIAQNALLETPITRSSEPKAASKSNERMGGPIASGAETLGDLAVAIPDSGHDRGQDNSVSITKSRGKWRSSDTSGAESIKPIPPTESLVDEAEPVVSPETQPEEQEQGSTSKQRQPRRTTRRTNRKSPEAVAVELGKPSEVATEVAEAQEDPEEEASEDEMQAPMVPPTVQNRSRKALATVEEEDWEEEEPESGRGNEEGSKVARVTQKALKLQSRASRPHAMPTKSLRRSSLNVKRPKNQRQRLSASGGGVSDENQDASEARTSGESVPITVHRLSRLHALQYGDDELSFLYGPPPFPKRNGVNAVDVLGQACREIIDKIVEKVDAAAESGRSEATKGEWKIKKKAARTFGTELESRLFDMSEALDNNWALSVRLRQANKEKAALRQELLRIRREREKVALRTDEVRRLHEESTKSSQARNDLNTALHDIELAVERGRTQQQAQTDSNLVEGRIGGGLELRLRTIAAEASSSSSGGGLLSQVKQFNAFLEKTATLLEGGAS